MPNDCINRITVYADSATIATILAADYKILDLLPPLPDHTPEARAEAYGTDRFYYYEVKHAGEEGLLFSICTAWAPPLGFLDKLIRAYPQIVFLKCDWSIEDGPAGIWVGERGPNDSLTVQEMSWGEGCLEERAHRFRDRKPTPPPQ